MATQESNTAEETVPFGFRDIPPGEKTGRVRGVFERVAPRYDLMNDLMSGGVHRIWKRAFVSKVNPQPGEHLLDVAGGTGDIARGLKSACDARARSRPSRLSGGVIVSDINEEMLRAGQSRADNAGLTWLCANAEALPLPDASMDAVTIAFGIRNVTRRARALAEFHRVLKPGGRFYCLEFSRPTSSLVGRAYDLWSFRAIPEIGALVARDRESYEYLVESIRRFPHQNAFAAELSEAGFQRVSITNLSGGIASIHGGWRI